MNAGTSDARSDPCVLGYCDIRDTASLFPARYPIPAEIHDTVSSMRKLLVFMRRSTSTERMLIIPHLLAKALLSKCIEVGCSEEGVCLLLLAERGKRNRTVVVTGVDDRLVRQGLEAHQ